MQFPLKISTKLLFAILVISTGISSLGYYKYFSHSFSQTSPNFNKISTRTRSTLDVEQKFYLFPIEPLSEFDETRYTIPMREQIKKNSDAMSEDICNSILEIRTQDIIRSELESFAN